MGMGIAEAGAIGLDLANQGVRLADTIDQIQMRHKTFKESKRRFDLEFDEDVRRYGIDSALKNYATREGISMAKAKQLYDAENLGLTKQTTAENLRTSAMGRGITATKFAWEKQDRTKRQALGKALQKGIVTGLFGGA